MKVCLERLRNGLITENPVFIMALGLCPTFAVTTSAVNAIGMGLSSLVVLMFSNLIISALSGVIPGRVRLPAEIVVVASLVTIVQLLIQALYTSLGIYIPLIVVNCIILGRAEAYALGAKPIPALFDGLGMGLGFTLALLLLGSFREIIGAGSIFGIKLIPDAYHISIFVLPPGAFFVMAFLVAGMQYYQDDKRGKKSKPISLEEAKTKVVKPVAKPAAAANSATATAAAAVKPAAAQPQAAAAAQATVATTAVEAKNPATEKKEEAK